MTAMRPSKNVSAPMNASMIAANPIQPDHADDMSLPESIVLMHCSFLGRRRRVGSGAAPRGSNAQDLLLLGRELLVREDPLVVQLREVLKLFVHVRLGRCGLLWRRSLLRLVVPVVVALIVVHRVLPTIDTPRRTPRGTASDSATWSEHRFLPFVFWRFLPCLLL